jgi:hypothetical protein
METRTFKDLKQGLLTLISERTGKPVEAPPADEGSVLDELDTLAASIDGVAIMLTYSESMRNDRAFVFTDFGPLPVGGEQPVMRRLLEVNFLLYRGEAPTFTIDPDSGHVMLMGEVPLAMATPELVLTYMREMSKQALEWRKTHFLNDAPAGAQAFAEMI